MTVPLKQPNASLSNSHTPSPQHPPSESSPTSASCKSSTKSSPTTRTFRRDLCLIHENMLLMGSRAFREMVEESIGAGDTRQRCPPLPTLEPEKQQQELLEAFASGSRTQPPSGSLPSESPRTPPPSSTGVRPLSWDALPNTNAAPVYQPAPFPRAWWVVFHNNHRVSSSKLILCLNLNLRLISPTEIVYAPYRHVRSSF